MFKGNPEDFILYVILTESERLSLLEMCEKNQSGDGCVFDKLVEGLIVDGE